MYIREGENYLLNKTSKLRISNSNLNKDGTGAQVQRIFSIAAYSNRLNLDFVFEPIDSIEIQHGDGFESEEEIFNFIVKLNNTISNIFDSQNSFSTMELIKFRSFELKPSIFNLFVKIPLLSFLSKIFNLGIRIFLSDAYPFTRFFPDSYSLPINEEAISRSKEVDCLNVQIHVRHSTLSEKSNRHVSPEFFLGWINYMKKAAQDENLSFRLLVHTDCEIYDYDRGLLKNHLTPETENYWNDIGITDQSGELDLSTISLYKDLIERIRIICPDYQVIFGLDPVEAWSVMAKSDVILASKSSFSFIGALLSKAPIVVAPELEMKSPSHWIVGDYNIGYNADRFDRLFSNRNFS